MSGRVEHLAEGVTLYLGDCREILPQLEADAIITDPVWPNVPAGLIAGSDRPYELFAEFCALIPASVRRVAIEMRNDSDPRFLAAVPARFGFIQVMWCQYAMPAGGDAVIMHALKFVPFAKVDDHFKLGWLISFPNDAMHHHHYGIEMCWICNCKIPGERL